MKKNQQTRRQNHKIRKKKMPKFKMASEKGLLKIQLLLRRADIFNARDHLSPAHFRRKFTLKNKLTGLVRNAIAQRRQAKI